MNVKLFIFIGAVAAGWTWIDGYAQALEFAQDQRGSEPTERAQVPGASDNMGRSAPDEGVGIGPSGQTSHGVPRTNGMDTLGEGGGHRDIGMPQQGAETGMQIDPGRGGLPGRGGANPLGPTSGGGSAGMAPSSGMGGSSGGMSGGASGGLSK